MCEEGTMAGVGGWMNGAYRALCRADLHLAGNHPDRPLDLHKCQRVRGEPPGIGRTESASSPTAKSTSSASAHFLHRAPVRNVLITLLSRRNRELRAFVAPRDGRVCGMCLREKRISSLAASRALAQNCGAKAGVGIPTHGLPVRSPSPSPSTPRLCAR